MVCTETLKGKRSLQENVKGTVENMAAHGKLVSEVIVTPALTDKVA